MPGTTRYSATFDRPYEEEEKKSDNAAATNGSRRSRSQSWQANVGMGPYTPLAYSSRPSQRSSSTDSGGTKGPEQIPTRTTSKPVVKTHNNPFQFVKFGSCPLYRKAEEQIKKVKEVVKQPEVLKEEEEEWQTNLDSWKSRRRKMSEDIFRRQEEIRQFENEEQASQAGSKKVKTFSEMVESRANRGRTMSLCLISSPLELQQWEIENQNKTQLFSEESEENSTVNSEDEGKNPSASTNGNGTATNGSVKNKINKLFELRENCSPHKDGIFIDSGLESISSSHRTGDTPDSCSDFSQDSGSSIDCDSPRSSGLMQAMNLLEDFNSKSLNRSDSSDSFSNLKTVSDQTFQKSVKGLAKGDSVPSGNEVSFEEVQSISNDCYSNSKHLNQKNLIKRNEDNVESSTSELSTDVALESSQKKSGYQNQNIESENEVFVDDFEELNTKTCLSAKSADNTEAKEMSGCSESATSGRYEAEEQRGSTESKNASRFKILEACEALPLNERKSESHSQENEKTVIIKKETNLKPRKKRATAKIVSVEINNQKADLSESSNRTLNERKADESSLNVVFQSPTLKTASKSDSKTVSSNAKVALSDVLPVEQIAEEMEKLILQQLEEEERAKELSNQVFTPAFDISPLKVAEPPKEKPPPPPDAGNETTKAPSVKRVNSTKRIKKEIHKRRSNFLGIENTDENICDDTLVPPPNALEQILKAEMELDRESMKRLENAAAERLKLEEKDIIEKERQIIANLETEEMQKSFVFHKETGNNVSEEDRIERLKEERKRAEDEKAVAENQKLRLAEEKLLREREDYLKRQEGDHESFAELSSPLLSDAENLLKMQKSIASSLCSETKPNESLSAFGDGNAVTLSVSQIVDSNVDKSEIVTKPAVPPKPVKKKEAIRKERERLRQEQEALQKEREEHRLKLLKEQELLKHSQKPNAPVSRLGPVPPAKPSCKPKLTTSNNTQPSARENVIFTSQSYHGAQNGISSRNGCVEPVPTVITKHQPVISQKKVLQNGSHVSSKMPLVKKASQESSPESKYNQNHWLIQEAEMRRITELKDRQRSTQFANHPQTHLAKDDVCSNGMVSVEPPTIVNEPCQDKHWSYAHPSTVSQNPYSSEKIMVVGPPKLPHPPAKPSRVVSMERPPRMLSVSGRQRCSHCNEELGKGAAMIIEAFQLYYHIQCFQCCVCQAQIGNGSCGADVRIRNNKLHCHNCYSNDEAGLKFSQV